MNISLILGHPRTDSFCHAIAAVAAEAARENGHVIALHDLYAERFEPLVTAEELRTRKSDDPLVERHCAELSQADGLIVVHPNWWGSPPAIVKGWIDRVIRPGVAYDLVAGAGGARTEHVGRLRVRRALVFNPSDTPAEVERDRFGNTLGILWQDYVAALSGIPGSSGSRSASLERVRPRCVAPGSRMPARRSATGFHRIQRRRRSANHAMNKSKAPPPRANFAKRLLVHTSLAFVLLVVSLVVGMLGYEYFERLSPLDAFLNTAMLLGGMGPVNPPVTPGGKLFAGLYALYAGLMFIVTAALLFTPILHRVLHRLDLGGKA